MFCFRASTHVCRTSQKENPGPTGGPKLGGYFYLSSGARRPMPLHLQYLTTRVALFTTGGQHGASETLTRNIGCNP